MSKMNDKNLSGFARKGTLSEIYRKGVKIILHILSIVIPILTLIIPILSLIKRREEKVIEKFHIRVLKKILIEILFSILLVFYLLTLPKFELIKTERNNFSIQLLISVISMLAYIVLNDSVWTVYLQKKFSKYISINLNKVKNIKRVLCFLSVFSLIIWIFSMNNFIISLISKDIKAFTSYDLKITSLTEFLSNYSEIEELKSFISDINEYIRYIAIYVVIFYFVIYISGRIILNPYFIKAKRTLIPKSYCSIKLRNGIQYKSVEFINRDEKFFVIKENDLSQAIFINQDEIAEIKLTYTNSIFIR